LEAADRQQTLNVIRSSVEQIVSMDAEAE